MTAWACHTGGASATFAWFRWGAGAEPGRTHLFLAGARPAPGDDFSWQCVVDDFGTLVVVGIP